jgi:DNA-binding NtrC family response regulator
MATPGLSVWVVDDDESVRWVLEQALKQAHMIPRVRSNPAAVLLRRSSATARRARHLTFGCRT